MRFAYDTAGMQNHRLDDAVGLVADCGYDGISLTLDVHHLDPYAPDLGARAEALRRRLEGLGLGSVVSTGARFLLDPRFPGEPSLVTPSAAGRRRRVEFLSRAIRVASILGSEAVSLSAGTLAGHADPLAARGWLRDGLLRVLEVAEAYGVIVALRPAPGGFVETVGDWEDLRAHVSDRVTLGLDTGTALVAGDVSPADAVIQYAHSLGTVFLADALPLDSVCARPLGEGSLSLGPLLGALDAVGYERLVCVALPLDSHRADVLVPESVEVLRGAVATAESDWPGFHAGRRR